MFVKIQGIVVALVFVPPGVFKALHFFGYACPYIRF